MKTLKILLFCSVAIMCFSCRKDGGGQKDGMVDTFYYLTLCFRDAEGNDLIKGIEGTKPEGSIEGNFVKPEEYSLVSSPDLNELWPYEGSFMQGIGLVPEKPVNPHPYPKMALIPPDVYAVWDEDKVRSDYRSSALIYEWIAKEYTEDEWVKYKYDNWKEIHDAVDGRYQFAINISSAPWYEKRHETITYTLTCPHVFGDDKAHEIVTYWNEHEATSKIMVCYLVEVDGKKFSDISHIASGQLAFATITIDRP